MSTPAIDWSKYEEQAKPQIDFSKYEDRTAPPAAAAQRAPSDEYGSTGFEAYGEALQTPEGRHQQTETLKNLAPGVVGAGASELGGPMLGGMAYGATKGLLSPEQVKEHPVSTALEMASFPATEGLGYIGAVRGPQILRTAGKVAKGIDLTKPLRTFGEVPRYWRESSPDALFRSATNQAISEGRAARIPVRLPAQMRNWGGGGGSVGLEVAPEDAIEGTLPRGFGRMVLTPEEALQQQRLYELAQRRAHERGMQFAGGQVPAEGRRVPFRPRPNITEEWSGKRE